MKRIALLSLVTAAACSTSPSIDNPYGGEFGTPENPIPQQASEAGAYKVKNTVDFTVEAILPGQIEFAVETLRTFSEDPARALLDFAEAKGGPAGTAVGVIRDALPGVLEDKLGGWINDEIRKVKINGKPITEYAGDVAHLAEFALTQFTVTSDMSIEGFDVTHTLTGIDLSPAGLDLQVPIKGLAADILTTHPQLALAEGGAVSFGLQDFGLMYGEWAWQSLEGASTSLFGQGIRDTIGKAVNCPGLAKTISDKCVLGACVGHEGDIKKICDGGLDAIVQFAHSRFAEHKLEVFQFASGGARLVDDDGDGVGDRIENGEWDAKMNLGLGLRKAPAVFEGSR